MITEEQALKIISEFKWTFAKTMAYWPHWYTVRQVSDPRMNAMYEELFHYIHANGYIEMFKGRPYKYCDIGDYKYWPMATDIKDSKVINRVPIEKEDKDENTRDS